MHGLSDNRCTILCSGTSGHVFPATMPGASSRTRGSRDGHTPSPWLRSQPSLCCAPQAASLATQALKRAQVDQTACISWLVSIDDSPLAQCGQLWNLCGPRAKLGKSNRSFLAFQVVGSEYWLGREDSNLRMAEPKSAALPLGYAP
jgi:hypothetical protein